MPQAARATATYAELLALPEDARAEVIAGELLASPSPSGRHSRVQRSISRHIGGPFDDDDGRGGPGGWWILIEIDVQFGPHDIVRPDVVGWLRTRLPDPWDDLPITVRPDWICEVTSPSNAAHDRVVKRALYARHGVPHYWIVDPRERVLECLQLQDGAWLELGSWGDDDEVRIAPFAEVALEVSRLFPPIR